MGFTTLIEPAELVPHLAEREWVAVDCRFDLADPKAGSRLYAAGHVPGARYAHLDEDLSGPVTAATGRHPLPDPGCFAQRLGAWGISRSSQVVAYDEASGATAARLWWMLRWVGHRNAAVMNGGFKAWTTAGYPVSDQAPLVAPTVFTPRLDAGRVVDVHQVASGLASRTIVLVDARASDRFAGRNETIDAVAGHVPGARNHAFLTNLDDERRFLAPGELRKKWLNTLADAQTSAVVCMCGSGVTACHNLLALEIAGLKGARLYAGSWSEWIRDKSRPVETGSG